MKLLKKLLSSLMILIMVLVVFFSAVAVSVFIYGQATGQQLIPELNSESDVRRYLKSIGENTSIPFVSDLLSSMGDDPESAAEYQQILEQYDPLFYPYFGMLNEDQKIVYSRLIDAVYAKEDVVNPTAFGLTYEEAEETWEAVFYDHPELFWLEESVSFRYYDSGAVTAIELHYNDLANDLEHNRALFDNACAAILQEANDLGSDYEKELYLHNALIGLCDYDLESDHSQSAYSVLVNKRSVCAGYAKAFQLLRTECGIPCYDVAGWSGENHAWNIVLLDGEYYNVDLTWDDGINTLAFFNRTDADLIKTHERRGKSIDLPACEGQAHHNTEPIPPLNHNL